MLKPRPSRREPLAGRSTGTPPTVDEMSAKRAAQPRTTGDIRPISERVETVRRDTRRTGSPLSPYFIPRFSLNASRTPPTAAKDLHRGRRRTVREVSFTSRTGPPPAGNEAAVSPSPLDPVQWADPRSTHGNASETAGRERTAGRTATHQEHVHGPARDAGAALGRRLSRAVPVRRRAAVRARRTRRPDRARTASGPRTDRARSVPGPHPNPIRSTARVRTDNNPAIRTSAP